MKIAAIIAEYNPFHNGHAYHIEETRRLTGADAILVIMSGDFVQRGGPAVFDKYTRARAALLHGADLVIELPSYLATASAEVFAEGGVRLLQALSCIHYLSFGSECGDLSLLQKIADALATETVSYQDHLKSYLKDGHSFAKARSLALTEELGPEVSEVLAQPNNILAIEYLKALKKYSSSIQPITIPRKGNGYHDLDAGEFSSATALRNQLFHEDFSLVGVPSKASALYHNMLSQHGFLKEDDFSFLLNERLYAIDDFTHILDVSREISDRILKNRQGFHSYTEWIQLLKTKQYSYTRISRCLLHILLDIKEEDFQNWKSSESEPYIYVLGLRKSSKITEALRISSAPIITSRKQSDSLSDDAKEIFRKEQKVRDLYRLVAYQKSKNTLPDEFHAGPVFIG